jgi:hypothetical protein
MSDPTPTPDPVSAERERVSRILAATVQRPDLVPLAQAAIETNVPAAAAVAVLLAHPAPQAAKPIVGRVLEQRRPTRINP